MARVDFAGFRGARRGFLGACASLARGLRRARAGLRGARAGLCGARAGRAGAARGVWEGSSGARARFAYGSRGVRARFRGARARLRLSSFCLCAWLAPSLRRSCARLALSSRGRRGRGSRWPRAGPQGAARSGRGRARRGGATSLRGAGPDFLCAFLRRYHAVNARAMVWTRLGLHFSTCSALRRCRASRFMRIALAALPRASGATDLARARPYEVPRRRQAHRHAQLHVVRHKRAWVIYLTFSGWGRGSLLGSSETAITTTQYYDRHMICK